MQEFGSLYKVLCYIILLYTDSVHGDSNVNMKNKVDDEDFYDSLNFSKLLNLSGASKPDHPLLANRNGYKNIYKKMWNQSSKENYLYNCIVTCTNTKQPESVLCCRNIAESSRFYAVSNCITKKCHKPNCNRKCRPFILETGYYTSKHGSSLKKKIQAEKRKHFSGKLKDIALKDNYYFDNLPVKIIKDVLKFPKWDTGILPDVLNNLKFSNTNPVIYPSSVEDKTLKYSSLYKNTFDKNDIDVGTKESTSKSASIRQYPYNLVTPRTKHSDNGIMELSTNQNHSLCRTVGTDIEFSEQNEKVNKKYISDSEELDEVTNFNAKSENTLKYKNITPVWSIKNSCTTEKYQLPAGFNSSLQFIEPETTNICDGLKGNSQNIAVANSFHLGDKLPSESRLLNDKNRTMSHVRSEMPAAKSEYYSLAKDSPSTPMMSCIQDNTGDGTISSNFIVGQFHRTDDKLHTKLYDADKSDKIILFKASQKHLGRNSSITHNYKDFVKNVILKDYSDCSYPSATPELTSLAPMIKADFTSGPLQEDQEYVTNKCSSNNPSPSNKQNFNGNLSVYRAPTGPSDSELAGILDKLSDLQPYNNSITISDYLDYLEELTAEVYHQNKLAMWVYETNMTKENENNIAKVTEAVMKYQQRLNNMLISIGMPEDRSYLREMKFLYQPGVCMLPKKEYREFQKLLSGMKSVYERALIPMWKKPSVKISMYPNISYIMARSNDPSELEYYWKEWRKHTGKKIRHRFIRYVELMKMMADVSGFDDAAQMWTSDYEIENLLQMVSSNWEEIRPLYLELHAYVRKKLNECYGKLASTGGKPIPVHLTGDMQGKSWNNLINILVPQPEKCLKSINDELKQEDYTLGKMAQKAEGFFHSLGFPSLPSTFWKNSIFERDYSRKMLCEPSAWDMHKDEDVRVKMCAQISMKDFMDLHHLMSHVEYYLQTKHLPFSFQRGANPAFHEAVAWAIELFIRSNNHLEIINLVNSPAKDNDINYLLMLALEKIPSILHSYVVDLWRYKIFQGVVKEEEYNKKWWELRLHYQGVSPPITRVNSDFDAGSIYHVAANKPYLRYYLASIMQFQFHEALCNKSFYRGPVHNCDITSSAAAGEVLRKALKLGSSKHWHVAMKMITGGCHIDSGPLLRYFEPLYKWLKYENKKSGQQIGWEESMSTSGKQIL